MSIIAVPADIQRMSQGYIRPAFKAEARKVEETAESEPERAQSQQDDLNADMIEYDADGRPMHHKAALDARAQLYPNDRQSPPSQYLPLLGTA